MSITLCVHMHYDSVVRAVDLTQFGESKTPLVKIELAGADIFVKTHSDIDKILRALADASAMIPVPPPPPTPTPATVNAHEQEMPF